jgi:hypothetical protein
MLRLAITDDKLLVVDVLLRQVLDVLNEVYGQRGGLSRAHTPRQSFLRRARDLPKPGVPSRVLTKS